MADITIVGLGPGNFGALTQETIEILKNSDRVYIRTTKHPVVNSLEEKGIISAESFDCYYEQFDNFSEVYNKIASVLIGEATKGPLVYAVPGHPLVAEESVFLLRDLAKEHGLVVNIIPAMSFIDPLLKLVEFDPINGLQIIDALQVDKQVPQPALANIIVQVYSRLVAQELKISLMDYYPDEHEILVIRAAGIKDQERVAQVPLYELDRISWIDYLTSVFIPPFKESIGKGANYPMDPLVKIMEKLRGPEGCPWDREQNHQSLKKYVIEETYEVIDALDEGNMNKICEELGDLLLQIAFHCQIADECGYFNINDVISGICEKLIRRHPHVFGDISVEDSEEVTVNWEEIKKKEKKEKGEQGSILDDVPKSMPALFRAEKIQKRAAKVGFDWPDYKGALEKVYEEINEIEEAITKNDLSNINEEIGDTFFALVNLARFFKGNPELALLSTINKFIERFKFMENKAVEADMNLSKMSLEELDNLWKEAKINLIG